MLNQMLSNAAISLYQCLVGCLMSTLKYMVGRNAPHAQYARSNCLVDSSALCQTIPCCSTFSIFLVALPSRPLRSCSSFSLLRGRSSVFSLDLQTLSILTLCCNALMSSTFF
uniref:Uncharacterized protein n=1 Tax=Picea glauca TaxID=3330 RepID=A0A124GNW1_PICGL|nr:hypothetical protein ABT39_MTgene3274 [Picea glauca]QHR89218.1 hypothetical protein Q903MT_gene3238 [Picea sitchensis]